MTYQPEGFQPDGYQPDGYQPVFDADVVYPEIAASRSIRLPSGGVWCGDPDVNSFYEVVWAGQLPDDVTLDSVAYSLPSGLSQVGAVRIDIDTGRSAISISGIAHGVTYQIQIVATLSNAQTLAVTAPLRCFNG